LCEEVHLNLAYRWFCHLGLEDTIPDHSTFSKNRHGRFRESDTFRHVFESVLRRCMTEGLVGGEGFAIDASVVKADANGARGVPGEQAMDWKSGTGATRAVREYLEAIEEANPTETASAKSVSLTDPAARYRRRSLLRLFDQLSGRYRRGHHCGCRGDTRVTHR
jgi:IS5 family transposase